MTARQARTYASLTVTEPAQRGAPGQPEQGWCSIRRGDTPNARGATYAEVLIYDEIGYYGITAGELVALLGELDVDEIDLRLNSPGGEVWDGIAIYNALVAHRARITARCEGIAASAASIVYMAGDDRVMAQGSQLMIHDAWAVCVGNAADMQAMYERLDAESNNIAGFYSARSGGTVAHWRKAMLAETWYSADEAVASGLADRVAKAERPVPSEAQARWDEAVFNRFRYRSRAEAPAPTPIGGQHRDPRPPIVRPPVAAAGALAPEPPDPLLDPPDDAEAELELGAALGAVFGTSVREAVDPLVDIDPDMFRSVVAHEANNRPAVPQAAPVVPGPTATELAAADLITDSLKELL